MRISTLFASITLAIICCAITTGCAHVTAESTFAIYDPQTDLKFDPRLTGVWLPDTMCVNLRRGDGSSYTVGSGGLSWLVVFGDTYNKSGKPDSLHLVKIGNYDYFFTAPKPGETGTSFTGCCKVEFADDRITLHGLNLQTVAGDLLKHPDALKHEWKSMPREFGPVVLSATQPTTNRGVAPATQSTTSPSVEEVLRNGDLKISDEPQAIRGYLIKHQDDADFFSDPVVLYRVAK